MEVSFEILIVLNTAILFTIAHLLSNDYKPRMIFCSISFVCWTTLAFGFLATNPTFPYFSYLFLGIAIILAVSLLHDALDMLRKHPDEDWYKRD